MIVVGIIIIAILAVILWDLEMVIHNQGILVKAICALNDTIEKGGKLK